jgi:hypothetical protein
MLAPVSEYVPMPADFNALNATDADLSYKPRRVSVLWFSYVIY